MRSANPVLSLRFAPGFHETVVSLVVFGALLPQASLIRCGCAAGVDITARGGFSFDTMWGPKTSSGLVVHAHLRLSMTSPSSIWNA